jgi:hypothetical protein
MTYDELGRLPATYRRLKKAGIEPFRCINHGPTMSLYFRGRNGLRGSPIAAHGDASARGVTATARASASR